MKVKESLAVKKFALSKQWHPTKNGDLTPYDVTTSSNKKAWWQCEKGHEWFARISHRSNGVGCPYCINKFVCNDNCLQTLNPELAKQWHSTKNGSLTPKDVTLGSGKKVWWQCNKKHDWLESVANRARGYGCPFCSSHRVCDDNSLQKINPELAKEWHSTKNGKLTPNDVTANSSKNAWWQCEKRHEWKAVISSRSSGNGCPNCSSESQTSFPEQTIYYYLKSIFNDALNRYKYNGKWEIDVFIPSLNFGIEYDGIYYHNKRRKIDSKKTKIIKSAGIFLLRIIETEKKQNIYLKENGIIYCDRHPSGNQLNKVIDICINYISENITHEFYYLDVNVKRDKSKIYNSYIESEKEGSFFIKYPELAKQWHPSKNIDLKPYMLKPRSGKTIWWQCENGHEWQARVADRVSGKGCPLCPRKRKPVSTEDNLQTLNPELAKQWHNEKNGDLTPNDVTIGSKIKVWWKCEKGHEWQARVYHRTNGIGCPCCSKKRASIDNCLQTINPELAKQWHPTKNKDLTPNNVTPSSGKKVWWKCEKGHEWEAFIYNRKKGSGCPICYNNRVETKK